MSRQTLVIQVRSYCRRESRGRSRYSSQYDNQLQCGGRMSSQSITKIHPTALIDPRAEIDPSVEIGPFCTVGAGVRIKKGTKLLSHVVVDGVTEIGENNTIFPFAVLGAVPQDLKYKGEKTKLILGHRNTIRESVTLNLGTVQAGGETRMGDDNLIMAYSHLGHDCI